MQKPGDFLFVNYCQMRQEFILAGNHHEACR